MRRNAGAGQKCGLQYSCYDGDGESCEKPCSKETRNGWLILSKMVDKRLAVEVARICTFRLR